MRIKLFENFDSLYSKIDLGEYDKQRERLLTLGEEKSKLKSIIKGDRIVFHYTSVGNRNIEYLYSRIDFPNIQFSILKMDDEWYLLVICLNNKDSTYYKCDRMDGLLKCLKDSDLLK